MEQQIITLKKSDNPYIINMLQEYTEKEEKEQEKESAILCKICKNLICFPRYKKCVNNSHLHTFLNPAGFKFTIGCFSHSQGCGKANQPTIEYTWFPGFTWDFTFCLNCQAHLGWFFQSKVDSFWGLIIDALVEE